MTPVQIVNQLAGQNNYIDTSYVKSFSNGFPQPPRETIQPFFSGLLVDYLTRLTLTHNPKQAFAIPLKTGVADAYNIVNTIKPNISDETILKACQLLPYDQLYRRGILEDETPEPTDQDLTQIKAMIQNAIALLKVCQFNSEDQIQSEIEFPNAFNDIVTNADADYMTDHVLIDMKVSKYVPYKKYWLQLLIYYIIGLHSDNKKQFQQLTHFAIINPRLNKIYTYPITVLDKTKFHKLERILHY